MCLPNIKAAPPIAPNKGSKGANKGINDVAKVVIGANAVEIDAIKLRILPCIPSLSLGDMKDNIRLRNVLPITSNNSSNRDAETTPLPHSCFMSFQVSFKDSAPRAF